MLSYRKPREPARFDHQAMVSPNLPLITFWLQVRILPGPPRSPANLEISWQPPNGPQLGGFAVGGSVSAETNSVHEGISGELSARLAARERLGQLMNERWAFRSITCAGEQTWHTGSIAAQFVKAAAHEPAGRIESWHRGAGSRSPTGVRHALQ
jgi:hypothetical protein